MWHDTDASRKVRPSEILVYMQETANRQFVSAGRDLDGERDTGGVGFILSKISLDFYKPVFAYEDIEVRTWCKEAKSYIFNRYFDITRDGELIAEATSTWVLIDINNKTMVRASSYDFFDGCFFYDEPVDSEKLLPKARISKDAPLFEVGCRKISYSDIDYTMHMNNTRYPDMICDYLCEMTDKDTAYTVSQMSLSYLKESSLGATLTVTRSNPDENGIISVRTLNESGETCLEATVKLEAIQQ